MDQYQLGREIGHITAVVASHEDRIVRLEFRQTLMIRIAIIISLWAASAAGIVTADTTADLIVSVLKRLLTDF